MSVKEEIYAFCEKMNADPSYMDGVDLTFQVNLKESGPIQMVIKDSRITVYEDCPHQPDLTITISDEDYAKLLKNQLNTTVALMTGKVKVDRVDKAFKLLEIVKNYY
ncbi:MAG TPA: SCP2 sterol-binding domain-containing protein [Clostridia bacterium]|nr:SCP2 sterol-binding domain-containing protein [Clostridia bacterium]